MAFSLGGLKIRQKFILSFLALGVIPTVVISLVSLNQANKGIESLAFNSLESVREIKKAQLEKYFVDRKSDMNVLVSVADTLRTQALEKLKAVREVKKSAIENYFEQIGLQVESFTESAATKKSLAEFRENFNLIKFVNKLDDAQLTEMKQALIEYYQKDVSQFFDSKVGGDNTAKIQQYVDVLDDEALVAQYYYMVKNKAPVNEKSKLNRGSDKSKYSKIHYSVHPGVRNFQEKFGYEDIMMIDSRSNRVIYSVKKNIDFGVDLSKGPIAESPLAKIYQKALKASKETSYLSSDFEIYYPSLNSPQMFIAAPMHHYGSVIGVVVFEINAQQINQLMSEKTGLGNTGETYLVGSDHLMRSDSINDPQRTVQSSLLGVADTKANARSITQALEGDTGIGITTNYLDKQVLSAWSSIEVGDNRWALMADIDVAEALSPVNGSGNAFYDDYAKQYGYPDLYLINAEGYVFFSSAMGADLNTNLKTGIYKTSSLSRLVKEVESSKKFGFSDYAAYAGDNNKASAFMAQPLIGESGDVELVIALKLPLKGINDIILIRDGMGETGESYLVGADFRMRSDSYLDPENRSVAASFAGNIEENGIKTDAVIDALAGNSNTTISTNILGNDVLSAYTPININGVNWALLTEINEAEAFAAYHRLKWVTMLILLVSVTLILFLGVMMASKISRPLLKAAALAKKVASGDLSATINVEQQDEIGELQGSLKEMNDNLKIMVSRISDSATQQLSSVKQLSVMTEKTREHVQEQNDGTERVSGAIEAMSESFQDVNSSTLQTSQAADLANKEAEIGSDEVKNTIRSIHNFAANVEDISQTLNEVEKGANDIGGIVDVINGIADQTNLLALNASIEAARAGDQGRGFAVVADEVRSLAQSTQGSTMQIEEMVTQLQKDAMNTATAMLQGKEQMQEVISQAEHTGEALVRISQAIAQIQSMTNKITQANQEQITATDQVTSNIKHISELSVKTGGDSEQILQASEELASLAESLKKETLRFKM